MSDEIKFQAEVIRVNTMMDGSIRFLFSVKETDIPQAAMIMECKRQGIILDIVATEADKTQHENRNLDVLNEVRTEGLG